MFYSSIWIVLLLNYVCASAVENNEFQNANFASHTSLNKNSGYSDLLDNIKTGVGFINSFLEKRSPINRYGSNNENRVGLQNNQIEEDRPDSEPIKNREGNWVQMGQNLALTMAKELISRSGGGNQILSLNFTNLLILLFLKALVFAAGLIGAGGWNNYGRARKLDENFFDTRDLQLFLGFLAAEGSHQDGCLYKAACLNPEKATEFYKAGKALLEGSRIINPSLPYDMHYNEILQKTHQAIEEGNENLNCNMIYSCNM